MWLTNPCSRFGCLHSSGRRNSLRRRGSADIPETQSRLFRELQKRFYWVHLLKNPKQSKVLSASRNSSADFSTNTSPRIAAFPIQISTPSADSTWVASQSPHRLSLWVLCRQTSQDLLSSLLENDLRGRSRLKAVWLSQSTKNAKRSRIKLYKENESPSYVHFSLNISVSR